MPQSAGNPETPSAVDLAGDTLPRHVAIIMDGNGRWAAERGRPRWFGHEQGAANVRPIITEAARLGLKVLTLYSFSSENWNRPQEEIDFLMGLYAQYLAAERPTMMENGIRFAHIGRRQGLSSQVLDELDRTIEMTADNPGMTLALAINYGSRQEITDAVRDIARRVEQGALRPEAIDDTLIGQSLYTAGLPDPDLLIRTAGEQRISNFLLWQISYAELHISPKCWPEFEVADFHAALTDFAGRERRFGKVTAPTTPKANPVGPAHVNA